MTNNIPLPRLLNAAGGTARRITPISVSVNLEMTPLSYASMQLPQDENVPARSYVELYTVMGSAGIYRVRSPQDAYGSDQTTAELEHAIVEVGDYIILDEYKEMMAASTAMQTVFSHYRGSKWQLGSVSALGSGQIALQAGYNRVLEAMLSILEQKPDCMMSFDFSTSPWTVNIVAKGTTVSAEGRLARNLSSAKVTYDDTELCTRAYYEYQTTDSEGDVDSVWAYIDADTMSTYGLIEREVQTGSDYTADEAYRVASEYISKHKHPRVSIETSLDELSNITEETLDAFEIGKLCRLALPDYGVVIEEHITGLSFPDVYGNPRNISARLAEKEDTAITFLHDLESKGGTIGGGGGGGRRNDDIWKEFRTRIEQDDYHIALVSEHVNRNDEILQAAGLDIDSQTGVIIYHDDVENGLGARLTVNAEAIAAEVERATSSEVEIRSSILQTASNIMLEVESSVSEMRASIQVTADNILSEVYASESTVYSTISQTAGGIRADMVAADSGLYSYIDATASYLQTHFVSGANKVFIQDGDPTSDPTYTPRVGDVWIESTHQGTWDGAEGFDWEHDADYDWSQVQGAKLWGWQNDKWELVSDQQQVVTMGDVIETAERYVNTKVKLVVNDEGNISVYMAKLEQEAEMIRSEVNDYVQSLGSSILQTASQLRSEVHAAESYLYSVVEQSASGVIAKVNESSNVYTGETAPTGTADKPIKENDVWIEGIGQRNWSDVDDLISWVDDENYDWAETQGSRINVYDGTGWREVLDERVLMNNTDFQILADGVHQISRSIETIDNGLNAYIGRLEVTSKEMKLDYTDRYRQLNSSITATAGQLRTEFNDTANGLSSSITQTASQIRSELNDRANGLSSSITQTASQIRSEVTDTKNSLQSSITQQANRISLVVEGTGANAHIKPASIVASINNSGSSVVISANKINLNGYVTTSMLESAFQSVDQIAVDQLTIDDYFTCLGRNVSWQSKTIRHVQVSTQRPFMYGSTSGALGTTTGSLVLSYTDSTIYYLGR